MRGLLRLGAGALALVAMMLAGSLVLWVGIPLAWLWIASQIQGATSSLGVAIGAAFAGVGVSIAAMIPMLSWLSESYRRQRLARGLDDTGHLALEVVMVTSAIVAMVLFFAWFFLVSGSSPIPLEVGF